MQSIMGTIFPVGSCPVPVDIKYAPQFQTSAFPSASRTLQTISSFAPQSKFGWVWTCPCVHQSGVFEQRMSKTADGFEMTWAVNVMAPFLLSSLLLNAVSDRIVNVSSISAGSSIDFSNLQQVGQPSAGPLYNYIK